ncbi:MAG: hypothetical protein HUJ95_05270 [Bacteroidales bacterium]|nr:hypothetical protein [Bacteroidales bacterium]
MIEKMTKYSFILLSQDKDKFIEELSALGVVDITRSSKAIDEKSTAMIAEADSIKKCISTLNRYAEGIIPPEIASSASEIITATNSLLERLTATKANIAAINKEIKIRQMWGEADFEKIASLKEQGCHFHFYSCSDKKFKSIEGDFPCEVIAEEKGKVWFVVVSSSPENPLPSLQEIILEGDIRQSEAKLETETQNEVDILLELHNLSAGRGILEAAYEDVIGNLDLYLASATEQNAAEGLLSVYVGFAPSAEDKRLETSLNAIEGVYCIKEKALAQDNPPIKLKNNGFVSMFERLTDMYGRPAYDGFDPTIFISIFFLLFFALCMGDAGYGIVLFIGSFFLKKVKGFASLAPLVGTLGVGTFVVGLFLHTFFSIDLLGVSWIPDCVKACMLPAKIAGYDGAMILSLIIGIIHLSLAMIVKTIYATKNLGFRRSVSVWGWTVFLVGTVIVLTIALAGVIETEICKWIIIGLGIVAAFGIFPFRTPGQNPLKNIGAGLWETYNTATGLLGDILSYLRLYALGLAGGMLGFAFNDLAKMALGDGGFGWIAFILIAVVGHVLNIAMAVLGAFVHPLRLNFLEFFKNSGYSADGSKYKPLTQKK